VAGVAGISCPAEEVKPVATIGGNSEPGGRQIRIIHAAVQEWLPRVKDPRAVLSPPATFGQGSHPLAESLVLLRDLSEPSIESPIPPMATLACTELTARCATLLLDLSSPR